VLELEEGSSSGFGVISAGDRSDRLVALLVVPSVRLVCLTDLIGQCANSGFKFCNLQNRLLTPPPSSDINALSLPSPP